MLLVAVVVEVLVIVVTLLVVTVSTEVVIFILTSCVLFAPYEDYRIMIYRYLLKLMIQVV